MKKNSVFVLIFLSLILGGCGEIPEGDMPGSFHEIADLQILNSFRASIVKESESGVFYLGFKNTNNMYGITPLLNKNGQAITDMNAEAEELLFTRERFVLSNVKENFLDVGWVYLFYDKTSKQEYYIISNKDGDGISITPKLRLK